MTLELHTEIKNIITGYDSDLIYILQRIKSLEKVAKAAQNSNLTLNQWAEDLCFDDQKIFNAAWDELYQALEDLEKS